MVLAFACDGDALYAGSAFLEPHSAAVAVETLGGAIGAILEVAVAAEDFEHFVRDELHGVDREQLADSSLLGDVLVVRVDVEVAGEVVHQATQRVRGCRHIGDLHLDGLACGDRFAERDAVVGACDAHFEHALAHAQVRCGDMHAGLLSVGRYIVLPR